MPGLRPKDQQEVDLGCDQLGRQLSQRFRLGQLPGTAEFEDDISVGRVPEFPQSVGQLPIKWITDRIELGGERLEDPDAYDMAGRFSRGGNR